MPRSMKVAAILISPHNLPEAGASVEKILLDGDMGTLYFNDGTWVPVHLSWERPWEEQDTSCDCDSETGCECEEPIPARIPSPAWEGDIVRRTAAEFVNPFSGLTPGRKMTQRELTRAVRLALAAEEEAVHLYEAHADAADNELAREVFQEIANEERVHAGEFQRLLIILSPDEEGYLEEGASEVDEKASRVAARYIGRVARRSAR